MPRVRWVVLLAFVIALVAPGSAIAGDIPPVAAYSFDAGEGAVAEDLAGEHDGAIEGSSWFDNGRFGKALTFDGANDCVSVPNAPALQLTEEFTLETWIKSRGDGTWEPILSKNGAYSIWLGEESGHLRSYIREEDENEALAIDPNGIGKNVWAHVAVTFDGQWMRLYIDGEFADKAWSEGAATTTSPLSIGCAEEPHEGFFEGLIDEVRVYNRALGAGEVAADMGAALEEPPRFPVAAYSFDAGEGAVAEDLFGEHDGTIAGASWFDNGRFGKALSFDAENDCVTVEDAPDLQLTEEFTLETWIKPQGPDGTWEPILFKEGGENGAYSIWLGAEPGKVEGYVVEEGEEMKTAVTEFGLGKNIWAHVALTYDGAWMRLYVNGDLVDSTYSVGVTPSEGPLQIGCSLQIEENYGGLIDEVRVYNRALGAGEVAADMGAGLQTPSRAPVAAYSFDEGEGEVAEDLTGNEHDGAIEGASWFANGKFGKALSFDGVNDCVTVEDAPDLQLTEEFTLETWFKSRGAGTWEPILFKEGGEFGAYSIWLGAESGTLEGYVVEEGEEMKTAVAEAPIGKNVWAHVALTYDGAWMRLYIDGDLVDATYAEDLTPSEGPLQIGCSLQIEENYEGLIDEVRVYNRELRPGEIAADMGAGLQAPSRSPVAAYSFDAGEGAVAEDLFGENDGAIEGAAWVDKGKFGSALYFDGSEGELVTVPDSNDLDLTDEFTLEAWVRPDEANEWSAVITKERGGALSYQMHAEGEGTAPAGYVQNSEGNFEVEAGDDPIPPRVWSHLTMTYDGQKLRYYINGEFKGEDDSGDPGVSEDPLFIGGNENWGEEDAFKGLIDEVRIYNRALGENQIAGDMTARLQTPSREPVAAYSFDAGEGAVAEDVFGEHDGAIEGATWFDNGKYGKALSFDGTNDCLSVPNDPALQLTEEFTLETWIKSRGDGTWEPILSKNGAYSIWLGEEPGHLRSYIREEDENEALAIDPNAIDENVWSHVAVTFDGAWMRLYVNGEFADKAWSEGAATTTSPLSIGCSEEPHEGHFEGLIDEVRVYNRAISSKEFSLASLVDTTPPTIELSGALTEGLEEGTTKYALHIRARDGEPGAPGSGVTRITILLDGEPVDNLEQKCSPGNCSLNREWILDTDTYGFEPHRLTVIAADQAGSQLNRSMQVPLQTEGQIVWMSDELRVSAPEPLSDGPLAGASTVTQSKNGAFRKTYVRQLCLHTKFYGPRPNKKIQQLGYTEECGNPFTGERGYGVPLVMAIRGAFFYKPGSWAKHRGARACAARSYEEDIVWVWFAKPAYECHYGPRTSDGNGGVSVGVGHYLRAQAHWTVLRKSRCGNECSPNPWVEYDGALELHLRPSGEIEEVVNDITESE
jgi:hypothetical protein